MSTVYNGVHNSTWSIMSTVHEADKNNINVKSYLLSFRRIGAYHYSTAYTLHIHT